MAQRWKNRPEGSNWGEFGEDDQIGRLNLLTPARRVAAAKEIKEGVNFILSLPLDIPGGKGLMDNRRRPQLFCDNVYNTPVADILQKMLGDKAPPGCMDLSCDDGVTMFTQYSTQWDAFCHFGSIYDANGDGEAERVYYNGWGGEHMIEPQQGGPYAKKLGIENMARTGVQGRGVLVDLVREYGMERKILSFADLKRAMEKQNVVVETGDILCLRTGYTEVLKEMGDNLDRATMDKTGTVLNGADPDLQKFVTDSGLVAICADNLGVEEDHGFIQGKLDKGYTLFPLHYLCLFKLGIHLGELWYMRELADWLHAHKRNRFFLTAPPLNLPGSSGSPATPVATV
jgi:kynurenine formamidase